MMKLLRKNLWCWVGRHDWSIWFEAYMGGRGWFRSRYCRRPFCGKNQKQTAVAA